MPMVSYIQVHMYVYLSTLIYSGGGGGGTENGTVLISQNSCKHLLNIYYTLWSALSVHYWFKSSKNF